jgi:hypothetical protein
MKPKMKNPKFIISLIAIAILAQASLGQIYWKRAFGDTGYSSASAMAQTQEGNFIVAGNSSFRAYLLKITSQGDTIWTKTYGDAADIALLEAIAPTKDGDFIAVGQKKGDVLVLRLKGNGDTVWTKTYGGTDFDNAAVVIQAPDGDIVVGGNTSSFGHGRYKEDFYVLKLSPDGDTIWTRTYDFGESETIKAIASTADGNFLLVGHSEKANGPPYRCDLKILKINPKGEVVAAKTYTGLQNADATAIASTQDGNFILAGTTSMSNGGELARENYYLKITQNGDTVWTKHYQEQGQTFANGIAATRDGNFIVVGETNFPTSEKLDGISFIQKIDRNGERVWTWWWIKALNNRAGAISRTLDGNFIVAGFTTSLDTNKSHVFLLSIIDDCHAYKNRRFSFKIPVAGDSLNHNYTPLKIPAGMSVSAGGTISWTPITDSVFAFHVEYQVTSGSGTKDTLTFNLFVNGDEVMVKPVGPENRPADGRQVCIVSVESYSSNIVFSVPWASITLGIYDIGGRQVSRFLTAGGKAVWHGTDLTGRQVKPGCYLVKILDNKAGSAKAFMLMR